MTQYFNFLMKMSNEKNLYRRIYRKRNKNT